MHFSGLFACIKSPRSDDNAARLRATPPESNVAAPYVKSPGAKRLQPGSQSSQRGAMRAEHVHGHDRSNTKAVLDNIRRTLQSLESTERHLQGLLSQDPADAKRYLGGRIKTKDVRPYLIQQLRELAIKKARLEEIKDMWLEKRRHELERALAKRQLQDRRTPDRPAIAAPNPTYDTRSTVGRSRVDSLTEDEELLAELDSFSKDASVQAELNALALDAALEAELQLLSQDAAPPAKRESLSLDRVLEADLEALLKQTESLLESSVNPRTSDPEPERNLPQRVRFASESKDIQHRLQRDQARNSPDSPRIASDPARSSWETGLRFMAAKHQQLRTSGDLLPASADSRVQTQTLPKQRSWGTPPKA